MAELFCRKCESILPINEDRCSCGLKINFEPSEHVIRVQFNSRKKEIKDRDEEDGPVVEKFCNHCNELTEQTYFTLQIRSADEGQTVFYKCKKCSTKTNENS